MTRALLALRLVLGAWMAFNGLNHFLGPFVAMPEGATPLATQLLTAFANSGLFDVAMGIELAAGLLLLAGIAAPFALAALMPLNTCALYWALVLNQQPGWAALALLALALNGALMLAHLDHYRALLRAGALAYGETEETNYGKLYADPLSPLTRGQLIAALPALLAALAFYYWVVPFTSGEMGLLVLVFPAAVLLIGGLRGMKRA